MATWQKAWDQERRRHKAYDRNPRVGGRRVGYIELVARPYWEPLGDMPESDLAAEGGQWSTLAEFCGDTPLDTPMAVVRFRLEAG